MELGNDIGEKTASGSEHAIGHVGSKFLIGLESVSRNSI